MLDVHYHVCPRLDCKHIWQHDRRLIGSSSAEHREAHTCPQCKKGTAYHACDTVDEAACYDPSKHPSPGALFCALVKILGG